MATPVYPKALASWTSRIDQVDTVWANDPNTLAAEILAVEKTLGTMPQVEGSVPVGSPVTYGSVSARISDAMLQAQHPYVELHRANFNVGYGTALDGYGTWNTYSVVEDNWHYFNGSDITIKAPGVYILDAYQTWSAFHSGWMMLKMAVNGTYARGDRWDWNSFPTSGPHDAAYWERWAVTSFTWMGKLNTGDRVRIASENATTNSPYNIINSTLRLYYLRSLTSAQAAQGPSTYPV